MRPVHVEQARKAASAVYLDIATFFTTRMSGSDTTINRQRPEQSSSALLEFVREDPFGGAAVGILTAVLPRPATGKTKPTRPCVATSKSSLKDWTPCYVWPSTNSTRSCASDERLAGELINTRIAILI